MFCKISALIFLVYYFISEVNSHFVWDPPNEGIDSQFHQDVIDPELCDEQVRYIADNPLLLLQLSHNTSLKRTLGLTQSVSLVLIYLAAGVLLEASLFNHVSDGPNWGMPGLAERCRATWWSTLLHMQNYMNPRQTCIGQTWYLAIDVQLHILSPIVLVWVLSGRKRVAWIALFTALILNLTAATVYNFINAFPSGMMNFNRFMEIMTYLTYYYTNTLTRAPPFIIGMIFGYLLHIYGKEKPRFSKGQIFLIWVCAFILSAFVIYSCYPILQSYWDAEKQILDSLYNSFIRSLWAIAVGLMIIACSQGFGGPVNWFLSLYVWKFLSRLSYALYIFHWALMIIANSSDIQPPYFTTGAVVFKFFSHLALAIIVSFILTLIVESPFNNFVKMILGGGFKKPAEPSIVIGEQSKDVNIKQS